MKKHTNKKDWNITAFENIKAVQPKQLSTLAIVLMFLIPFIGFVALNILLGIH